MRFTLPILLALLTLTSACVLKERRGYLSAREAYESCLADPLQTTADCEPLRAEARVRAERYEENAQRSWGCENQPDECKPPRGP